MRKILTVFAGPFVFLMWGEKSNACTPTPNFTSSATSICQGQSVNFTSTGGAGTPAATSWTWTFPGGTPGTSTAQHPAGIVYNTPGIYDVTHTATNTYSPPTGTITKTGYITVLSSSGTPVVNLGADIPNACPSAVLDAGNPAHSYLWSTGATTKTITVTVTGTYSVTVTNSCSGNSASDDINVTFAGAPFTVDLGNDITTCNGNSVFLDAGNPGVGTTYLWSTGATTQTLTVTTAGTFSVTATRCGTSASDDINITLNTPPCNSAPPYTWANSIGNTGIDIALSIAVDGSGNVHITGYFSGTVDFDPGAGTANLTSSSGSADIFFAKYDASGNYLWAKSIGGASNDCSYDIAIDGSGNVHITGYFNGTVDFNPGAGTANLTSDVMFNNDIFFAKYDASGNYLWAKGIGSTSMDYSCGIAVDVSGNVYITGYFPGTADFDPGAGTANLTAVVGYNIFFAKYDDSGNYLWAKNIGSNTGSAQGRSIAVDVSGNVYITGYFSGTADFDPGAGTANLTAAVGYNRFVAKYNSAGVYQWAFNIGDASGNGGYDIAVDDSGNSYITGAFNSTADFDPGAGVANLTTAGVADIFFAKYDASGNYLWAKSIGGPINEYSQGIAIDGSGNVHITGSFLGTVDFDPGTAVSANLTSSGSIDIFFAKYDASGNYLWAKSIGGANNDYSYSIAIDGSGNVHITGCFNGTADFDPDAGVANLTSSGSNDIFIAKYGQGAALPIELLSFTGYNAGDKNILEWSTVTEINNDYFTVERSLSFGDGWAEVGTIKGAGNSSSKLYYQFTDTELPTTNHKLPTLFYRLKQTDFDGQYSYSNIIAIKTKESTQPISIFPNPAADGQINVLVSCDEGSEIFIEIMDITGRKIISHAKSLQKGTNKIKVDMSLLGSGIYYLRLSTESGLSQGEKIIVIK